MRVRVATFNIENLFSRPRAMNFPTWAEGQTILDDYAALQGLLAQHVYTPAMKAAMLALLRKYRLHVARPRNRYLELRVIRGRLLRRSRGEVAVAAEGRADWVGWVELTKEPIADQAIANAARVIAAVDPDILALVEVENRPGLELFYETSVWPLLAAAGKSRHGYTMVIDGRDSRGIDVGIVSRFEITSMRSRVHEQVFSRDCPEYRLRISGATSLVVLPNHFASKGSDPLPDGRRNRQAERVRQIVAEIDEPHVIVAGDLNDHPAGGSLHPLLARSGLTDAMALPAYGGEHPGTYRHARADQKLDYLLLSPELVGRVRAVDVFRKGYYAPTKWESFPTLTGATKDRYRASDHHCLWADLDLD